LRIPTSALQEGNKVLVYRADTGKLEERPVKVGLSNWEYTEILEGLTESDRIVVSLEREGVKTGASAIPESKPPAK
jgi:HlyD family secretion protein